MKALAHKAKLAFLMNEDKPTHFFQLEDGRILMIEITNGQLAGFVADGAIRLSKYQSGASYEHPPSAVSALEPTPAPDADAFVSDEAKR